MQMKNVAAIVETPTGQLVAFRCPGCKQDHHAQVKLKNAAQGPLWSWNGSLERPTFSPSILVTYNGLDAGKDNAPQAVCHSFVTDGKIQFLGDSTHKLAGQTVELEEF